MVCVCGHSDDLHHMEEEINGKIVDGYCEACPCKEFCEDIDMDELKGET